MQILTADTSHDKSPSLAEYKALVDRALGIALSEGLRTRGFVSIAVQRSFRGVRVTGAVRDNELIVSPRAPTFYRKGLIWLCSIEDSPYYRLFSICATEPPEAARWVICTNASWIYDPLSYVLHVDSIGSSSSGGGPSVDEDLILRVNASGSSLSIGTPVYSDSATSVSRAVGNSILSKNVVGLCAQTFGAGVSGQVKTGGVLGATVSEWNIVTNTTGGLVAGQIYYLDLLTPGRLTLTPPEGSPTEARWAVALGTAMSTTLLKIEIQPSVKIS